MKARTYKTVSFAREMYSFYVLTNSIHVMKLFIYLVDLSLCGLFMIIFFTLVA